MPRIRNIDIRKDRTLIRFGKNEIEIPGNRAALKDWIRERCAAVDDETKIAMQLLEHMKTDANLSALDALYGKDIDVAVSMKETVNV